MSWLCRWPNHGERGLKLVEGRAAWLMLVVLCCCCQLLYCILDKTTYVEVFGRLCTCTLVQKQERGKCLPSPTWKCYVGIKFVSAHQGRVGQKKSADIWLLGRHIADMSATLPAKNYGTNQSLVVYELVVYENFVPQNRPSTQLTNATSCV